jgi:predicted membrane protein
VKEMDKMEAVSVFLIALGALLVIHHVIFWQRLFDVSDALHHEFFEAIFFTAGITLLIAKRLNKARSAEK